MASFKKWAESKVGPSSTKPDSRKILKQFDKLTAGLQSAGMILGSGPEIDAQRTAKRQAFIRSNMGKLQKLVDDMKQSDDPGAAWVLESELARWQKM